VTAEAKFEHHGMTSLTATELQLALQRRLGMAISPATIWGHPTIRTLAAHLERRRASDRDPKPLAAAPNSVALTPSAADLIALGERLLGPLGAQPL